MEPADSACTVTKSSTVSANTSATLAKIAGVSSGNRTRRIAWFGVLPRSIAASSYSGPIESNRARTMITG